MCGFVLVWEAKITALEEWDARILLVIKVIKQRHESLYVNECNHCEPVLYLIVFISPRLIFEGLQ